MSHDLDYVGEDYRLTLTCVEMFIFYDFVLYFLWILNLIFFLGILTLIILRFLLTYILL